AGSVARGDDGAAARLRRRRRPRHRRAGSAIDRQALLAPLRHAAAEPVDRLEAGDDGMARRLVRLPALGAVAHQDERLVLRQRIDGVVVVLRRVEVDLLQALLAVGGEDRATHVLAVVFLLRARVDERDTLLHQVGDLVGADSGRALDALGGRDAERGDVGELLAGVGRGDAEPADARNDAVRRVDPLGDAGAFGDAEVLADDDAHS